MGIQEINLSQAIVAFYALMFVGTFAGAFGAAVTNETIYTVMSAGCVFSGLAVHIFLLLSVEPD